MLPLSPRHIAWWAVVQLIRPVLQALTFRRKFLATSVAGGAQMSLALDTWLCVAGLCSTVADLATVQSHKLHAALAGHCAGVSGVTAGSSRSHRNLCAYLLWQARVLARLHGPPRQAWRAWPRGNHSPSGPGQHGVGHGLPAGGHSGGAEERYEGRRPSNTMQHRFVFIDWCCALSQFAFIVHRQCTGAHVCLSRRLSLFGSAQDLSVSV